MKYTPNYNLAKPENYDAADIDVLAGNADKTDAALAAMIPKAQKGAANGVAELDSSGKVPAAQLPAYVDDVLEYATLSAFPAVGEAGKIYVALDTNKTYRWSGSTYVEISASLALGETSSTACRGDLGKAAYGHCRESGNPHSTTAENVGAFSKAQSLTPTTAARFGLPASATPDNVLSSIAGKLITAPPMYSKLLMNLGGITLPQTTTYTYNLAESPDNYDIIYIAVVSDMINDTYNNVTINACGISLVTRPAKNQLMSVILFRNKQLYYPATGDCIATYGNSSGCSTTLVNNKLTTNVSISTEKPGGLTGLGIVVRGVQL